MAAMGDNEVEEDNPPVLLSLFFLLGIFSSSVLLTTIPFDVIPFKFLSMSSTISSLPFDLISFEFFSIFSTTPTSFMLLSFTSLSRMESDCRPDDGVTPPSPGRRNAGYLLSSDELK